MAQILWMSSKTPNALNYLQKKQQEEQEKKQKKENLFDFSSIQTSNSWLSNINSPENPSINFWPSVSQKGVTNFQDFKSNIPINNPITKTQSNDNWFNIIPKAWADYDYLSELEYDIKNWATVEEILKAYPEVNNNSKMINELIYDINNWATLDEVKEAYPELKYSLESKWWLLPMAGPTLSVNPRAHPIETDIKAVINTPKGIYNTWAWFINLWAWVLENAWNVFSRTVWNTLWIVSDEELDNYYSKEALKKKQIIDSVKGWVKQFNDNLQQAYDEGWTIWWINYWLEALNKTIAENPFETLTSIKPIPVGTWLVKSPKILKDNTVKLWKNANQLKNEALSWLNKEQINWLQSNPYQSQEFDNLIKRIDSTEWLPDIKDYKVERVWAVTKELTNEIDNLRKTKWETSQVYSDIRNLNIEINPNNLIKQFEDTFKLDWLEFKNWEVVRKRWIEARDLSQGDISRINQQYQDLIASTEKWYLTPSEILTYRKTLSDLANYDDTIWTTWQNIFRDLRKKVDVTAKEQVPGLKDLDAQFVDKLNAFEDAIKDLVYKQWDAKGEWRSNIVNIIWTLDRSNRAKLLERLEEVLPGIWSRIEAIDNLATIYKALQNKWVLDKYSWTWAWVIWATTLWNIFPWFWHVLWFVLWYWTGKWLEKWLTSLRQKSIKNIISKMSPKWQERLKSINEKISNKKLISEQDKIFIDELKQKIQNSK